MSDIESRRETLQETMNFMAALACGLERVASRGANGTAFVAGKKLGKQFSQGARKTDDLGEALEEVRRVLGENDCLWQFESFKPRGQEGFVVVQDDGSQQMRLVFRDCMIRQSLFRFGHPQKGSLCYMMYGFFSGALEEILGRKTNLTVDHAGQNACLKTLTVHAAEPAESAA